ncbi:hypothetical protein Syun_023881 [Stephania yunnanensis]|uniref:Uncharacterized protein n=1 Tax=Stephania yunnanensis TaxID=152371 RepID=A0AAP0FDI8_9MAGN
MRFIVADKRRGTSEAARRAQQRRWRRLAARGRRDQRRCGARQRLARATTQDAQAVEESKDGEANEMVGRGGAARAAIGRTAISLCLDIFYAIRKSPHEVIDDDLDSQCECLLQDDPELWSFDNHADLSTADYIFALEQELQTLRSHVDNLQSKFRDGGLEIELHLKKNVRKLEKREVS